MSPTRTRTAAPADPHGEDVIDLRDGAGGDAGPVRRTVHVAPARQQARHFPAPWWGMVMLITTEAMIFAALLSAYFYVRAIGDEWPPGGIEAPEIARAVLFTVVLLGSSIPVFWAEHGGRTGDLRAVRLGLFLSAALGTAFLINLVLEYRELGFSARDSTYASLFWFITGLHGLHVLFGLGMNGVVQAKAWTGRITRERHLTLRMFGMYWHFVDGVWIFVFVSLYLSPHWGGA
jgi:heme/copper-type cytochrome/quinol oxidase subunit 3